MLPAALILVAQPALITSKLSSASSLLFLYPLLLLLSSLSPCCVNKTQNEGPLCLACPVSYGALGPNWMRARLLQPSLLIILITLILIRGGWWDMSTTHKGPDLVLAQLGLTKGVCVQQWICLNSSPSTVINAWWCLQQTIDTYRYFDWK